MTSVSTEQLHSVFEGQLADKLAKSGAMPDDAPIRLKYFSVASAVDAAPLSVVDSEALAQGVMLSAGVSATTSGTHLIDNIVVTMDSDDGDNNSDETPSLAMGKHKQTSIAS